MYEKETTKNVDGTSIDVLKEVSEKEFSKGEVGFMSDNLGQYHKIGSRKVAYPCTYIRHRFQSVRSGFKIKPHTNQVLTRLWT